MVSSGSLPSSVFKIRESKVKLRFIDRDEKGVKLAKHTASASNRLFLNTTVPGKKRTISKSPIACMSYS